MFGNRNPHGIDNMALNNPYASNQRHDRRHVQEYKKVDARLTPTSVFPSTEFPLSNPITTMEDMENGNEYNLQIDQNSVSPLFSDVKSSLLPASFDHSSNVNQQSIPVNKAKPDYNGSFVSHIPMMSSSSSSTSIPALPEPAVRRSQTENLTLDQPRTRSIVVGQETLIEIDREQSGLGLSVVGGSDTQLVRKNISTTEIIFFILYSRESSFMIFMKVVRQNVMDVCLLVIKFLKSIRLIYVQLHMKRRFKL